MNKNRKRVAVKQEMQKRAEDLKSIAEQRAELVEKLEALTQQADTEQRAFTEEEEKSFDETESAIKKLDDTLKRMERARDIPLNATETKKKEEKADDPEALEERAFAAYVRGEVLEERADVNMTTGDNGAVIPSSIANKIIKKVHDISPIFQLAEKYHVSGNLSIPYYDESSQQITMAYATEFTDLESTSGKFASIELKGFLAGALSKVSKSLINNSSFDIVPFVINEMAESVARWIENQLLNGTKDKIEGLSKVTTLTAAAQAAVTADELIDVQEEVPDVYQADAIWIMSKKTRTAIRKLKDSDGNYILNKDATSRWGYSLFGKDVYTSENMPDMAAGKRAILYGDMSGLAVKISEDMNIQVLQEKFATQHAVGIISWIELDAKIQNAQKLTGLTMKAASQSGS